MCETHYIQHHILHLKLHIDHFVYMISFIIHSYICIYLLFIVYHSFILYFLVLHTFNKLYLEIAFKHSEGFLHVEIMLSHMKPSISYTHHCEVDSLVYHIHIVVQWLAW